MRLIALTRRPRTLVALIFFAFLLAGLLAYDDYGVSADEPLVLWFGYAAYKYLFLGGPQPAFQDWVFYGPAVQVVMVTAMELLGLTDGRDIWLLRHLLSFWLFLGGAASFYCIGKRCLGGWQWALLAVIFLMLSPRVFAHAFYNTKDIPAMVFFLFAVHTMLRLLERRSLGRIAAHALCCGMLISLRVFGLLVPLFTLGFLLLDAWRDRRLIREHARTAVIFLVFLCIATVVVWPALWGNPLKSFLDAYGNTTTRTGGGFYFGELISGNPWHYLPVWVAITTPPLYLLLFILGGIGLLRHPLRALRDRGHLLILLWIVVPVAALLMLGMGIFDEWRHMLFVYPAFLVIATHGLQSVWIWAGRRLHGRTIIAALVIWSVLSTAYWMVTRHPFQYLYFSIPARFVEGNFDLDYWSLSYRQGLEYILANDRTPVIRVYPASRVARAGADTLPLSDWERLEFSDPQNADYILDNFRGHDYRHLFPEDRKIHAITVDSIEALAIYRGPDRDGIFAPHHWIEDERK